MLVNNILRQVVVVDSLNTPEIPLLRPTRNAHINVSRSRSGIGMLC